MTSPAQAADYVIAYFELHPSAFLHFAHSQFEDLRVASHEVYDAVNAATEGDLEQIVHRDADAWVYALGVGFQTVFGKRVRAGRPT